MTRSAPMHSTRAEQGAQQVGTESPSCVSTAIRWRASLTRTAVPSQRAVVVALETSGLDRLHGRRAVRRGRVEHRLLDDQQRESGVGG